MTPDQITAQIRSALLAAEQALEAKGDRKSLRRVKIAHAVLQDVADEYVQTGDIAALSVGGDKP